MFLPGGSNFLGIPAALVLAGTVAWSVFGAIPTLLISTVFFVLGAATFPSAGGVASYVVTVGGGLAICYGMYIKARVAGFKEMEAAMKGSLTEEVERAKGEIQRLKKLDAEKDAQLATVRSLALEKETRLALLEERYDRVVTMLVKQHAADITADHPMQTIREVAQVVREAGQIAVEASQGVVPPEEPKP